MRQGQYRLLVVLSTAALVAALAACSSDDGTDPRTLTIATVDNVDLERLRDLSDAFTEEHPDLSLEWVVQGENEIRQTISTDVGTQAGRFDVVSVGTYESEVWAGSDYLTPLTDMPDEFDTDEFIPATRDALSHDGTLQAAPFYGESLVTMYRRDVLDDAGIEMPDNPTWRDILDVADQITDTTDASGIAPVCVRGKSGWGENVASLSAMAHAYGARWFDEDWSAQLDSSEWTETFEDYVALADHAPDNVTEMGYQENLEAFAAGDCAVWVDTSVAASYLTDPEQSSVSDDVEFTRAPTSEEGRSTSWLWSWALAIPESSDNKELAKEFITWATSNDYTELVTSEYGWANVPPGARADLYDNPDYLDAASFAPLVLASIENADVDAPATDPVPYVGIQYVAIPGFQSLGTAVGQQLVDAISGEQSVGVAQDRSQWVANEIIGQSQMINESSEME
ncbi:sugar ABC transporter substrate-binding protein [Corynebacterium glyciniphilum]|uniref:ABC transporter substrate-binding protein n=1 Tax=Corynebacterium glyciniphilum TaxID=1404244 RepID=UPI0023526FD1